MRATRGHTAGMVAGLAAAAIVGGLAASSAEGAVRSSTYQVAHIQQTQHVRSAIRDSFGRSTVTLRTKWSWTGRKHLHIVFTSRIGNTGNADGAFAGIFARRREWSGVAVSQASAGAPDGFRTGRCKLTGKRPVPRRSLGVSASAIPPTLVKGKVRLRIGGPSTLRVMNLSNAGGPCEGLVRAGTPRLPRGLITPEDALFSQRVLRRKFQGRRTPVTAVSKSIRPLFHRGVRVGRETTTTKIVARLIHSS